MIGSVVTVALVIFVTLLGLVLALCALRAIVVVPIFIVGKTVRAVQRAKWRRQRGVRFNALGQRLATPEERAEVKAKIDSLRARRAAR